MMPLSTVPILVIGLGCRQGCSAEQLLALIEDSLGQAAISLDAVRALASIEHKREEPGLIQLAAQLNLPLRVFSAEQLAPYAPRLSQRSTVAFEQTGCFGVAESAALALAEHLGGTPASLLIPRTHSSVATFALALAEHKPR